MSTTSCALVQSSYSHQVFELITHSHLLIWSYVDFDIGFPTISIVDGQGASSLCNVKGKWLNIHHHYYFYRDIRSSPVGISLVNICISFTFLYISYIVSHFMSPFEVVCTAFSFLLHYFLLVSTLSLPVMVLFMGWAPSKRRKLFYFAGLFFNWGMIIMLPLVQVIHFFCLIFQLSLAL